MELYLWWFLFCAAGFNFSNTKLHNRALSQAATRSEASCFVTFILRLELMGATVVKVNQDWHKNCKYCWLQAENLCHDRNTTAILLILCIDYMLTRDKLIPFSVPKHTFTKMLSDTPLTTRNRLAQPACFFQLPFQVVLFLVSSLLYV